MSVQTPADGQDEREAIHRFAVGYNRRDTQTYASSLVAAIREARALTGRVVDTGEPDPKAPRKPPTDWSGALMYLVVLDLMGSAVRRKGAPKSAGRPVDAALSFFALSSPSPEERRALVALRNSFAHNFGLTNPQEPRHRFMVVCSDSHPLVRLPAEAWNGKYGADSTGGVTVVNLRAVGNLVEECYSEFRRAAEADELVLANGISADALNEAFGLWIGPSRR